MIEWYEDVIKGNALKAQRLKERSDLGERFLNRTFKNFTESRDEKAYKKCFEYAEREDLFKPATRSSEKTPADASTLMQVGDKKDTYRNGLVLTGGYGTGKTHLAAAIANNLVDKGIMVLFDTYVGHLDRLKREMDSDEPKVYLDKMKSMPMLVIDDLGKEKKTDWSQQILFNVLNYRYEHYLPTVITTNMTPNELPKYVEGAIASRLMETFEILQMRGTDFRNAKNR